MVASSPIRLGLIGCGRLGAGFYVPAIAAAEGAELTAIAEPDLERSLEAREAAAAAGTPVRPFPRPQLLVESGLVDAVVIAGPPETHVAHAEAAAAAGIPALVEKPPGGDASGAERLAALEPAPMIGFNRRFSVDSSTLGSVPAEGAELMLQLRFLRRRWRPHVARPDALADAGAHLIDLALSMLGEGDVAVRAIRLDFKRAEAEVRGPRGRALISAAIDRPWRERVEVRDRSGAVRGRWAVGGLGGLDPRKRESGPDPLTASLIGQVEAFARAVRGEDPGVLATARDGSRVMAAVEAIRRSHGRGNSWLDPFGPGAPGVEAGDARPRATTS